MNLKLYLYTLMIVVIASSCRRANYFGEKVEGHNYQQYKTYAWLQPEGESENGENLRQFSNDIHKENIMQSVNREMQARGYELDNENPDMLLRVTTETETRRELVTAGGPQYGFGGFWGHPGMHGWGGWGWGSPYGYGGWGGWGHPFGGWGWHGGYTTREVHYQHAIIVVDMFNRRTNKHIWRGGLEKRVNNPERFRQRLNRHINRMFDEFPVDANR
ncbi:MAG: DUF4136 domain-containing protein [Cytophagaceae bacterium]